jgi:hypothetical protein
MHGALRSKDWLARNQDNVYVINVSLMDVRLFLSFCTKTLTSHVLSNSWLPYLKFNKFGNLMPFKYFNHLSKISLSKCFWSSFLKRMLSCNFREEFWTNRRIDKDGRQSTIIKLGLPITVPDLVYQFQMICLRGTQVIELKPNVGRMYIHIDEYE